MTGGHDHGQDQIYAKRAREMKQKLESFSHNLNDVISAVCVGWRINRGKRYEMHSSSRQLTTSVFTVISIMFVLERGRKQFASFNFCFLVIVKMPPPR